MRPSARVLVLIAAVLITAGCSDSQPGPVDFDGRVTLAVAVPISGDLADFGQTIADGVRLAAKRRNAEGGLLGDEVIVEVFDDGADAASAPGVAEEVVASGAPAVIGHFNSGPSIAAAQIYADAGILQITPTATNVQLTDMGISTIFRVSANDAAQGPTLANQMIEDGRKRPAALYAAQNTYAEGLARSTIAALAEAGVEVVAEESFPPNTRDWATQLDAIRGADPDSLLLVAEAPQAAAILVQARDLGIELPTYGGDSLAKREFLFRAGSTAEGATVTALVPDIVSGDRADAELVDEYREEFGRNPGVDTPAGMVAAEVWFRGVEAAGDFDAEAVAAALKSGFVWDSPIGKISYDAEGDVEDQRLYVNVVRNGVFEPK